MPKREPGFSEPSLSDEPRIFDGGEDDSDAEGSRLPLLLVIALIMVFAFGGVVWLAYKQGEATGRSSAPQVIAAEQGPTRTAPANPGGQTPYQGLKVYEQPAPANESEEAAPAKAEPSPPLRQAEATPAPAPAKPALQPPPSAPQPRAVTAPNPEATARAAATPEPEATAPAAVLTAPPPVTKLATKTMVAKAVAPTRQSPTTEIKDWTLQLGAYKSAADAQKAWQVYSRRYPAVARYQPSFVRVDLGSKGVWYRLHIGAFDTRDAATAACDLLKAAGAACFPARG